MNTVCHFNHYFNAFIKCQGMKNNDNSKPATILKIHKTKYKLQAEQHGPLTYRGKMRCLGGVSVHC